MGKAPRYVRTTERFTASSLRPEAMEALGGHAESVGVELDLADLRAAVRTLSESTGRGLFGRREAATETVALLTGRFLILLVGEAGSSKSPTVLIRRLDALDASEYDSELIEDVGVNLTGAPVGGTERGTTFLPLDLGMAGAEFREALFAATRPASSGN